MILKRTDSHEPTERRFQGALHFVAGLFGWLIPDTDAAVEATRLEDENVHGKLPPELQDPLAVLDRGRLNAAQGTADGPLASTQTAPVANINDTRLGLPTVSGTAEDLWGG